MPLRCRWVRLAGIVIFLAPCFAWSFGVRDDVQATGRDPSADWQRYRQTIQPFFAKHCFACHTDKKRGDVRLDQFQDEQALVKGVPTLEKALVMLRKKAMPPNNRPQPREDEVKPVLAWLDTYIARMDQQLPADPGPVLVRRLNRAEYNNTVRDLLGVDFHPAEDFPPDVPGNGFDNSAGNLSVTPALMEKYLTAAERVARTALFGPEAMKPERTPHQPFFTADAFSTNKSVKFDYDETGMSLPSALHVVQRFPVEGEYRLRAILRGVRPPGSDPVQLGFWIDGKLVHEARVEVPTKVEAGRGPGELNGKWAEFRTRISAGEHWLSVTLLRMYEGLPPAYKGPKPANTTAGISRATDAFFPMYLDVVGPYEQAKGPSETSLKKIFTCGHVHGPHDAACARKILADLARRAYRRPVTDKEVEDLVRLVEAVQKDGDSLEEGLCLAIQRLLISPQFLFRIEKPLPANQEDAPYRINQYELAIRLSYFLWSSMPDEELLRCAEEGKLRQPDVLEAQVRRMLKDARSSALVENFGGQWLQTRALESHTPDRTKFTEFTDYTRMSMKKETELFFEHILRADRSILDFIDANYTFLNQRLAEFYGIPGVKGHEFRKVDLTGTHRGGVLAQASVLTVSSYANRTSPVLRGKWILENLLNAPPPPPPPDVPVLDEQAVGQSVSLREQLEKHRANPTCASCHARMDPLGFALENFDAIGRWRDKDGKLAIDPSGTLPDGRSFKSYEDLRALLTADPGAFTECLAEKLLIYALGRGLERGDRRAVKTIAEQAARDDYRFSRLVLAIVRSAPFQMLNERRNTP
jgi:mono/diheme cytochrome c family protein